MPKFSVCVVARDEEKSLPGLLSSLRQFLDAGGDLVLLDTGSKDRTAQIALDAGASVTQVGPSRFSIPITPAVSAAVNAAFVEPNEECIIRAGMELFDYGAARNLAESLAQNNMVCTPDADERFERLDLGAMNCILSDQLDRFEVDFQDNPTNRFWYDARWHDRRAFSWVGTMHEHLVPKKTGGYSARIPTEACFMVHEQAAHANRSTYLANIAYSLWKDPTNERQAHCLARQLMYEKRYRSAVAGFMRHAMMGGIDANLYNPLP